MNDESLDINNKKWVDVIESNRKMLNFAKK